MLLCPIFEIFGGLGQEYEQFLSQKLRYHKMGQKPPALDWSICPKSCAIEIWDKIIGKSYPKLCCIANWDTPLVQKK